MAPILHLSVPVSDLTVATAFYRDVLGCDPGRRSSSAADVWFLGMQLTLQERPDEVLAEQGVRHFGATLDEPDLDALCARVVARGGVWLRAPHTRLAGTPQQETKAYLADPDGNVIELKAYADHGATLRATSVTYA